jgi:hypothetical protein
MAPDPLNQNLLRSVGPDRRDFLRSLVAGTAFTVPLMTSFSMDGLSLSTAGAFDPGQPWACFSNMTSVPNMTTRPEDFRFRARLKDAAGRLGGTLLLEQAKNCPALEYKLTVRGSIVSAYRSLGGVLLSTPSAQLEDPDLPGVDITLTARTGFLQAGGALSVGYGLPSSTFGQLVLDIQAGIVNVHVITTAGDFSGLLLPA